MTWRDPRKSDDIVKADCVNLRELADTYQPFIRWSDTERFFPALVEAWLQHATSAPWPDPSHRPAGAETGTDDFRRGTALVRADLDLADPSVLLGTRTGDDEPISLDPGNLARTLASQLRLDGLSFLDFGGWRTTADGGAAGDLDYLFKAFSELAAAINPKQSWEPIELMAHLPQFWTPQPPTPTVYCEARWASDFATASAQMAHPDFPPVFGSDPLADVLVLTYHYFYPAREPSSGEPAVRAKEGQWEAVSVFFRGRREGAEATFSEPPLGVAVSQGTDGPSDAPNAIDFRTWDRVHHDDTHAHAILFSALGTHRFFFDPTVPGEGFLPGAGGPTIPAGGSYDNNPESPGWESLLVVAAILAAAGAWVAAVVVFLIWLFSWILDSCNDDSENPSNPFPSNPEAQGDGPQAGDPDEPPAPGSPGGDGSAGGGGPGGGFGVPNSGAATGSDSSSFDLRFIDRIFPPEGHNQPKRTGYPSADACENPTWWDYTGRWGIRVPPSTAGTWASGDQRVDELGRSWGYWHTLRFLVEHLAGHV